MTPHEASSPGLHESLRRLGATLVAIVRTRLAILTNDIEIEKATLLRISLLTVGAIFFLGVGFVLLTLLVVLAFWEEYRVAVLTALTILYWAVGLASVRELRRSIQRRHKLLSHTLTELMRDQNALTVGRDE